MTEALFNYCQMVFYVHSQFLIHYPATECMLDDCPMWKTYDEETRRTLLDRFEQGGYGVRTYSDDLLKVDIIKK